VTTLRDVEGRVVDFRINAYPPVPECQSASVFRLRYFEPTRTWLRCPSALTIIASGSMRTI